ncbi:Uncharacterized protein predicted to be involved in DNA repair (RAMP superfamily) [uncultured Eubacterium sp.]|nr:Uncharacterized protein predicted to be involved in DNA repair (RAMP superfamily) [uncultured Eubacterium sp.]
MKVIKIILTQTTANYRQPEQIKLRSTFPLPPVSTILGGIHKATRWGKYHPIHIGIKGKYGVLSRRTYTNQYVYDRIQYDRGYFVRFTAPNAFSNAYIQIAKPLMGGALGKRKLRTGEGFVVLEKEMLDNFFGMKDELEKINNELKELKTARIKETKGKGLTREEKRLARRPYDEKIENLTVRKDELNFELSHYQSFEKIPMMVDLLNDIKLTLHLVADSPDDYRDILGCIYDIKSFGRSEDFINVETIEELDYSIAESGTIKESIYIPKSECKFFEREGGKKMGGTVYYLNEQYHINEKGQRIFNKIPCLYASNVNLKERGERTFVDETGELFVLIN